MQDIYLLIGQLVESFQVLEHNLVLTIKYAEFINKLKSGEDFDALNLKSFEEEVDKLYIELSSSTLGKVVTKIKEICIFSDDSVEKLYKVLQRRNEIMHTFFKVNNFALMDYCGDEYNGIVNSLFFDLSNVSEINGKLCEIINLQQIEYSNLLSKNSLSR